MPQPVIKLNDLYIPSMSYDAGFYENASKQKNDTGSGKCPFICQITKYANR